MIISENYFFKDQQKFYMVTPVFRYNCNPSIAYYRGSYLSYLSEEGSHVTEEGKS